MPNKSFMTFIHTVQREPISRFKHPEHIWALQHTHTHTHTTQHNSSLVYYDVDLNARCTQTLLACTHANTHAYTHICRYILQSSIAVIIIVFSSSSLSLSLFLNICTRSDGERKKERENIIYKRSSFVRWCLFC